MPTHFTPAAVKFLKGLKKNNDREWFAARKHVYETELQQPWLALVDEVNEALAAFAPDYVKPARKAVFRIYRDTRFSADKRPYKTRVAAWWSPAHFTKTSGAGFYAHVSADDVVVAAGIFMPTPEQTLAIRRHLQEHHAAMRKLLAGKKLRALMPDTETDSLKRMPKGFAADDPAGELLLQRKWGVSATLALATASTPGLRNEIVTRIRASLPMVELLNAPLSAKPAARKTFF